MALLLGKLDPKPISRLGWLHDYQTAPFPALPTSVAVPSITLQMDGNGPDPAVTNQGPDFQGVGDCTVVGTVNLGKSWNAEVHESDAIPSPNDVVSEYFTLTGGQDSGMAETDVLNTWHSTGLFGDTIAGFAPVQHNDITQIEESIAFFGGCYFGVQLPQSAQQQFNPGGQSTWSVVNGSPIEGGHCIVGLGFDQTAKLVQIATWGQIVNVEYGWLSEYLDEAYAIIPHQFVEAGKGPSLDLAALTADLKSI